jgi:putative copper export protein
MHTLYVISVWLHIVAATIWVGGMLFLVLVIVPYLRRPDADRAQTAQLVRDTGLRFRRVGWSCFALLAATGTANLMFRGVTLDDFASAAWRTSSFGHTVLLKLAGFGAVVCLSAVHDFVIGPRAADALLRAPGSPQALRLRRAASYFGRLNVLLALALIALGVVLVRG